MKIRLLQLLSLSYLILAFILSKKFSLISAVPFALFIIVLLVDALTNARAGIKNLLYILVALSSFPVLLKLFLIYLPFAVFGCLLSKKGFVRSYIFGFAVSFIPATLMYLFSTYLSLKLNLFIILAIFYFLPLARMVILRRKSLEFFEAGGREAVSILIVLSLTTIVALSIIDEKSLFMANGVREFSRLQNAVQGLRNGEFVAYNPAIAQGEATFLWNAPSFYSHISLSTFITGNTNPILSFNYQTFFILFLSILSLSVLLYSISPLSYAGASASNSEENKKENSGKTSLDILDVTAIAVAALAVGLNFFFLQLLESFKQYYSFPIAYLFLSIILDNPIFLVPNGTKKIGWFWGGGWDKYRPSMTGGCLRAFREFVILMYLSLMMMLVHIPYGAGVNIIAVCLLLLVKSYYIKDRTELKQLVKWALDNKLKIFVVLAMMAMLPLFYITPSLLYKDFFAEIPKSHSNMLSDAGTFFKEFFQRDIKILSLKYPDVTRIDDHKSGALLFIFGAASFFFLILMYRIKSIKNFRSFAFGFILNLVVLSFITSRLSLRIGGFYRTVPPYLLILMGASILTFILLIKHKLIKIILIASVFLAFAHSIPYARENLANIHKEMFASGEIYQNELNFIKGMPVDGRIMTYGLFSNAIDFGGSYLTGRYFSRNERIELAINRTIFEKIHGQHSFGQDDLILTKSGAELYNYLRLGGYKYLFLDARHPIGRHVALQIYPNFSRAMYQNGPLVIFEVNNVSYAEKVELAKSADEKIYKEYGGYKYIAASSHYNFNFGNTMFKDVLKEVPNEPQALKFERESQTKVKIFGSFNNDFVVFKEQFFPRWKAYMGGREVPVYATNHDLILVKTIKGDEVLLQYSVLNVERAIGVLSIIGFLMLGFVLVYNDANI